MADEIIASRMKFEAFAGMNGDASASSKVPGDKPIARGTVAKTLVGPPVTVPAATEQTRTVSAKPIKPAFAQTGPKASQKVPNAVDRVRK